MVDTMFGWIRTIFVICVVAAVGWFLITNAAEVGNFVVMVVRAIWTFVTTVFNGVAALF